MKTEQHPAQPLSTYDFVAPEFWPFGDVRVKANVYSEGTLMPGGYNFHIKKGGKPVENRYVSIAADQCPGNIAERLQVVLDLDERAGVPADRMHGFDSLAMLAVPIAGQVAEKEQSARPGEWWANPEN